MNPRISMITLGVQDIAKSIKFYKNGLGFPQMDSAPEVAFFTLNGSWLGLYNKDDLAKDASVSSQGEGFNNFTLSHNVKSEKEVEKVYSQALEAGATSVKSPQKTSWGGFHGYFKDLDGHLWEIAYNPFFWVAHHVDIGKIYEEATVILSDLKKLPEFSQKEDLGGLMLRLD